MNIDPRLFGAPNSGAQQVAGGDAQARAEIAAIKKFIATKVGSDIQLLSKAIADLNGGAERAIAQLAQRVSQLEAIVAHFVQASGGTVEHSGEPEPANVVQGQVVEAANVRPGDENLPPAYFEGATEEEGP